MSKIESFYGEYRFLSNFWYAKTKYEGNEYPTVEHAYQAAKSNDEHIRELFITYKTPGKSFTQSKIIKFSEY